MKRFYDAFIGIGGCLLATDYSDEVAKWTSIICSVVITLTTCLVQAYRIWRDRDNDKNKKDGE